MENVVARAILKSNEYYNTGYIYIHSDSGNQLIEGIFTRDYADFKFFSGKLYLKLKKEIFFKNTLGILCSKNEESLYRTSCKEHNLYIPENYFFEDINGNMLTLEIQSLIRNSSLANAIIRNLESIR